MEEAPIPIKTPVLPIENQIGNFTLEYNHNNYNISLIDINNDKIKIFLTEQINGDELYKYEVILELDVLKTMNKYFKMFDNYEEFKKDFIELFKPTNIKIINVTDNEITLTIKLIIKSDNLFNITLNKIKMTEKEQLDFLLKDSKNKTKIINNLSTELQKMKNKISNLEKIIKDLTIKINDISELKNKFNLLETSIKNRISEDEDILFINEEINITKNEKDAKSIELDDICFKNIGQKTFLDKDNLYFFKGEESSNEIFFTQNQNLKIKDKQNISIQEDIIPLKVSKGHKLIIEIDKPSNGKTYYFFVYVKCEQKEIIMKHPLKITINILNDENKNIKKEEKEEEKEKEKEEKEKEEKKNLKKEKKEIKDIKEKEKKEKEKNEKVKERKEKKEKKPKLKNEKGKNEKEKLEIEKSMKEKLVNEKNEKEKIINEEKDDVK